MNFQGIGGKRFWRDIRPTTVVKIAFTGKPAKGRQEALFIICNGIHPISLSPLSPLSLSLQIRDTEPPKLPLAGKETKETKETAGMKETKRQGGTTPQWAI